MKRLNFYIAVILSGTLMISSAAQAHGRDSYHKYGHHHTGAHNYPPSHGVHNTYTPHFENRVERRQDNQWERIRNGVNRGLVSPNETRHLMRDQKRLAHMERRFERDGYYSDYEKYRMERAFDKASDRIWHMKHYEHPRHSWHQPAR